jgi:hypothetical protein
MTVVAKLSLVFLATLSLALAYDSPSWGSCKSGGGNWSRPGGDVANSATGVSACAGKCAGYVYFGLECPRANEVHCQCANNLGDSSQYKVDDVNKCKSNSGISGSHCAGPYEHGSTMMGGHGFGSVYITPTTPSPTAAPTTHPKCCWNRLIQSCTEDSNCDSGGEGCILFGANTESYGANPCNTMSCESQGLAYNAEMGKCVATATAATSATAATTAAATATATAAATATATPEHGWTKWKGTTVLGTACHSACQTGTLGTHH